MDALRAHIARASTDGLDLNASDDNGFTAIALACYSGHLDAAEALVRAGADPSAPIAGGFSPVHLMAQAGSPESIVKLLSWGADPNARSENGSTPLMVIDYDSDDDNDENDPPAAATAEKVDAGGGDDDEAALPPTRVTRILEALLEAPRTRADPTLADDDGTTALHFAATAGNERACKILLGW
jgi:ankyrin repeat protein